MSIKNKYDLAKQLKIQYTSLMELIYGSYKKSNYKKFNITKKNGNIREINAPIGELKRIQHNLAEILYYEQIDIHKKLKIKPNISHGFEKNKSIITNAKIHRNKRYVLNMDLKDFFDTIHFGRIKGYFEKNKYFKLDSTTAMYIAQICCYEGKLPQGAPTSPIVANLICQTMDYRLLKLVKQYKLDYTRYADDLTFSTNDKNFLEVKDNFIKSVTKVINKAGFEVNDKKTRLQYKDSRQMVTGLVVNKKISVNRDYVRETRAMAYSLYTKGYYILNGEKIYDAVKLHGRFTFINQIDYYNNKLKKDNSHKKNKSNNKPKKGDLKLNSREKEYKKFLFYHKFWCNSKPLIITEGKTDVLYLKAALKHFCEKDPDKYSSLISKNTDGKFNFHISFFKRTKRMQYFFDIALDGADTFPNIFALYKQDKKDKKNSFRNTFLTYGTQAENPVIFIMDNELTNKDKPINKFLNNVDNKTEKNYMEYIRQKIECNNYCKLINDSNLYLMTNPIKHGMKECEIEDLFTEEILNVSIQGKTFKREENIDKNKYFNKDIFSKYIMKNYKTIDFENFIPMIDNLNEIIRDYKNSL